MSSNRPPYETFKRAWCRGSFVLGTACGKCEKCEWERNRMSAPMTPSPAPDRLTALIDEVEKATAGSSFDAYCAALAALRAEAASVEERLARAERDTARLDWLEKHRTAYLNPDFDNDTVVLGTRSGINDRQYHEHASGFTVRHALDGALSAARATTSEGNHA